jgi:hypothetical protein
MYVMSFSIVRDSNKASGQLKSNFRSGVLSFMAIQVGDRSQESAG